MAGRYLEEVDLDDPSAELLINTWTGCEAHQDGLGERHETLCLRPNGSFTHTLAHALTLQELSAPGEKTSTQCCGQWRLFNVRHLGADVDVQGDRELVFERAADSPFLHSTRIVVCGINPHVNGFLGAACRLKPQAQNRRGAPDGGFRLDVGEEDHTEEVEDDMRIPTDAEVNSLQLATGRSTDECFAALLQHGDIDSAAVHLLEQLEETARPVQSYAENRGGSFSGNLGTVSSTMAQVMQLENREERLAEDAERLAEATGCALADCATALEAHGGRADAAAEYLLMQAVSGSAGSSASSCATPGVGEVPTVSASPSHDGGNTLQKRAFQDLDYRSTVQENSVEDSQEVETVAKRFRINGEFEDPGQKTWDALVSGKFQKLSSGKMCSLEGDTTAIRKTIDLEL